ncbi:lipoyltransferase and lipoate-protein ligase [Thermoanaerobacter mathranii subsp. mathranii str. A3]|uniref:lipoate--protein ligase n=3 Tax=Thermoanaerobacter TaxID=1754 RepID=D3T647_THEIA|nr:MULTISPECIES: lipoate--protein ligase [Thermoanaerobacter]ADD01578.1 lipoyltransferase and lipoate-protein ligase [Thermoanaerobacter italicus Ab9]ADH60114.1 lipoyltransferase and lipoate-protein ligase [Thermoanaerobacter mathranii subsp. mathranii str. A3]MDP9752017.1 lipoate-protein ligase A [Thermoanaerobacter pentosaceus]
MLYIYNKNTNPYFNLAAEEYILKEFQEECFMLWRNEPSIIIGKNQNTLAEINLDYVRQHKIPVVRRLSGGGAVFHDLGNLNFTFIVNEDVSSFSDFKRFTQPIIDVLRKLSINAEFSGRNDITIDGKKISGNAQYYYKNRILHHGTLLFSSSITDLSAALKVRPVKFEDKGVKSVSKRVTNISEHLKEPITIEQFIDLIMNHIREQTGGSEMYEFTQEDIKKIEKLVREKYSTWEWNFGTSPDYKFKNEKKFAGGTVEVNLNVEKGIIKDVKICGDFFGKYDVSEVENLLKGVKHSEEEIKKVLSNIDINDYLANITVDNLIEVMF